MCLAGRFSLDAIESVCCSEDVLAATGLNILSSLLDKSLVVKEDVASGARYRLHETMREYTRLRLREAGEEEDFELRCTEHYVARCRQAALEARYHIPAWLEWIDLEIDNVRAVLRRCLTTGDLQRGIELTSSLMYYWITRASTEGVQWLDAFLSLADGTPAASGGAYFIRGFLASCRATLHGRTSSGMRSRARACHGAGPASLQVACHGIHCRNDGRRPPNLEALARSG